MNSTSVKSFDSEKSARAMQGPARFSTGTQCVRLPMQKSIMHVKLGVLHDMLQARTGVDEDFSAVSLQERNRDHHHTLQMWPLSTV